MLTILASLLGFFTSAIPDVLAFFKQKQDHKQELDIMDKQLQAKRESAGQKLQQINVQADIEETRTIYKTYNTGVKWVDAYNGTVRPTIAYAFFILYAVVKGLIYVSLPDSVPIEDIKTILWTQEDAAIFAGIISFYFGQRAMAKLRRA